MFANKSSAWLFWTAVIHVGISISSALFGKVEGGEFFFSIPEYLVGVGYIISLLTAAHDDYYYDDSLKNTIKVIVVAAILALVMGLISQLGVWVIITGGILVILFCAFGATNSMIFISIVSLLGAGGLVFGVIVAVAALFGAGFTADLFW